MPIWNPATGCGARWTISVWPPIMPCGLRRRFLPRPDRICPGRTQRIRRRGSMATFAALVLVLAASACGYHVAGRGNALPVEWKTIAVPALGNKTTTYRIEQRLTAAVVREMLARTHYRIVADDKQA